MTDEHKDNLEKMAKGKLNLLECRAVAELILADEIFNRIQQQVSVKPVVMRFAKPIINDFEFVNWMDDQHFYSTAEETPIDKYILQSYYDTVEQFINSPESSATKSVFEIATQTIKRYLAKRITSCR